MNTETSNKQQEQEEEAYLKSPLSSSSGGAEAEAEGGRAGDSGEGDSDPEANALESFQVESNFKIKTVNRRHVDFDLDIDLNSLNDDNDIDNNSSSSNYKSLKSPFFFVQAADSQLGMIDSYIYKRTIPGWQEELKLCKQLIDLCHKMEPKPLFLIVCGDLVDSWPGTEIRRKQVIDFKKVFSLLSPKIPLVCVCGNHDVGNEPTQNSINEYNRNFGDDYFYFTKNNVLFIVINSQFYQHRENVKLYAKQQDYWLEWILNKCKYFKYSLLFEHIPWFLNEFNEENDYFNIKKEIRLKWLRKFKEAGINKIFCGHYHRNAGGWYENMELVVTSAIGAQLGEDQSGARIVKVLENSIEHKYYSMQEMPQQIDLTNGS